MANSVDIARLRLMVDEPDASVYTDQALSAVIDQAGSPDIAAVEIWEQKAARFSSLVDVTESGSSRKMGTLYKQAQEMASYYRAKITTATETPAVSGTRTRTATRL